MAILLVEIAMWRKRQRHEVIQHEFISIIAHKFRTPLTQVKWLIETILANEQDPYRKQDLKNIRESNEKLIVLMETLISLTNGDRDDRHTYELERVPVCDFVRGVAEEMRPLFQEKNISFAVLCDDADMAIKINRIGIQFALQALIHNSCTYSHPGTKVDVVVKRHFRKVTISVIDAGIGIEHRDLTRVFSKFYRADNAERMDTEGFGVSLFISQSIVRRNKGTIKAYSAGQEKGSIFTITLPRVR